MNRKLCALAASLMLLVSNSPQAQDTIKIGVLTDLSGPASHAAGEGSVIAAKMAAEKFGSIAGRKIEVLSADYQMKTDTGAVIARRWYDSGVDVIVDLPTSPVALAVAELAKDRNKVMIASLAGTGLLTGKACTENTVHWAVNANAFATSSVTAAVNAGLKNWFAIVLDSSYGTDMIAALDKALSQAGGKLVGSVKFPFATPDFSSFILQAQSSKADVVAFAGTPSDMTNGVKQAKEYALDKAGITLLPLNMTVLDAKAIGFDKAEGMMAATPFYWDYNAQTREWGREFAKRNNGKMPTFVQAGVYSGVLHYLKAVEKLGSPADGRKVVAMMKELPTSDEAFGQGTVRADGRKMHDFHVFRLKGRKDAANEWDLYSYVSTVPAEVAFGTLAQSDCHLVKK